jgi:hypothetical protein
VRHGIVAKEHADVAVLPVHDVGTTQHQSAVDVQGEPADHHATGHQAADRAVEVAAEDATLGRIGEVQRSLRVSSRSFDETEPPGQQLELELHHRHATRRSSLGSPPTRRPPNDAPLGIVARERVPSGRPAPVALDIPRLVAVKAAWPGHPV